MSRAWPMLLGVVFAGGALSMASASCAQQKDLGAGGDASGASTSTGQGGSILDLDGGGTGGGGSLGCSADLQSVVDGHGVVVETCPPDRGCASGQCVPACDAASASKGSVGCDFLVATPSFYEGALPPCFALFLANDWQKPVKLEVSRAGVMYDVTKFGRISVAGQPESSWPPVPATGVPVGKVAVLFLSGDPASNYASSPLACPVATALGASSAVYDPNGQNTGRGSAWHVRADVPVTAYDILPYGGAGSRLPSAELLLPTAAWGKSYYGVVPKRSASPLPATQWAQVTASVDHTTVTLVPSVDLPSGAGVAAAPKNTVTTYTLDAGDYLQWQDVHEMSSSVISADKPVAFQSGNIDCYSSKTSPSGGGCDMAHQQIPAISALGFDYVAPPFATRMASGAPESIPYRLVGAVAGTTLTYDPPVAGAPATLGAGEVVDFESTLAFRVTSQDKDHPFYVGQIMPGCSVTGGSAAPGGCLGDEEFVNVLPPAQYLSKYTFFTDGTYPTTNLVFVREKSNTGFNDVKLDCLGVVKGWKPVGASGEFEITTVDLIRGGVGNGACDNGPHTASSEAPFGLMVWGLAEYASYAYPAGGNAATINGVVVLPVPK